MGQRAPLDTSALPTSPENPPRLSISPTNLSYTTRVLDQGLRSVYRNWVRDGTKLNSCHGSASCPASMSQRQDLPFFRELQRPMPVKGSRPSSRSTISRETSKQHPPFCKRTRRPTQVYQAAVYHKDCAQHQGVYAEESRRPGKGPGAPTAMETRPGRRRSNRPALVPAFAPAPPTSTDTCPGQRRSTNLPSVVEHFSWCPGLSGEVGNGTAPSGEKLPGSALHPSSTPRFAKSALSW